MTISRLDCLAFHTDIHTGLSQDHEYDVVLRHEVYSHPRHQTVEWQVNLDFQGLTACEVRARYRLQVDDTDGHEWTALEASWPYLRQQAGAFLAEQGLPHFLPVDLPLDQPQHQDRAPKLHELERPEIPPRTPSSEPLPRRPLPLPGRLTIILSIQQTLQRIVQGEGNWLLGAVQLYGALLGATRSRSKGTRLEWHVRNDTLQARFFEDATGASLSGFRALELFDQRMLLATARQIVAALMDDVLTRQSNMMTGQLTDSFQDDVDNLINTPDGADDVHLTLAAKIVEGESQEDGESALSHLYQYVVAPLKELRRPSPLKEKPLVEHIPLLNGEPMSMTSTGTFSEGGCTDILSVTMIITDAGYLFEDPDPLSHNVPLSQPTMYRLRHLHLDQSQAPALLFVTDLNLDTDVSSLQSDQLDDDFSEEQLARWRRARELSECPWPRHGQELGLQDLEWPEKSGTLQEFETWILQQEKDNLTTAQWQEIIRVEGLDLEALVRRGQMPVAVLTILAEHPDEALRREVAEQVGLPEALMDQLWNDSDEIRLGLARNSTLSEHLQRQLAHVESVFVREELAFNPSLLPELLELLAEDPFYPIRMNVAGNTATAESVLRRLAGDSHEWVRDEALKALSARQLEL
ncbi:hypothetical protein [Deinococcus marmoris]|uniref:Uncharacterized protein n=1 Tax=Deinococcus marmoris TaxID=249408 RepID=A0A1U7P216_9DEIO|nr:hypothetical protein [Deinococcus marmoris]OLV19208.1 hypothetical protein BOO71_0003415 [Deinococcus marmoris]